MSKGCIIEKNLKVDLSELKIVRLVCDMANCGGVAEMPTDRLQGLTGQVLCPSCSQPFIVKAIGSIDGLKALGMSLQNLIGDSGFSVEFVVPTPD